jgi:hypothetical protein
MIGCIEFDELEEILQCNVFAINGEGCVAFKIYKAGDLDQYSADFVISYFGPRTKPPSIIENNGLLFKVNSVFDDMVGRWSLQLEPL